MTPEKSQVYRTGGEVIEYPTFRNQMTARDKSTIDEHDWVKLKKG